MGRSLIQIEKIVTGNSWQSLLTATSVCLQNNRSLHTSMKVISQNDLYCKFVKFQMTEEILNAKCSERTNIWVD